MLDADGFIYVCMLSLCLFMYLCIYIYIYICTHTYTSGDYIDIFDFAQLGELTKLTAFLVSVLKSEVQ